MKVNKIKHQKVMQSFNESKSFKQLINILKTNHQEMVIFRFAPQVFEDDLFHVLLHQIPIFNYSVPHRPLW